MANSRRVGGAARIPDLPCLSEKSTEKTEGASVAYQYLILDDKWGEYRDSGAEFIRQVMKPGLRGGASQTLTLENPFFVFGMVYPM